MYQLSATIKAPLEQAPKLEETLQQLGVTGVARSTVPYARFVQESRLNWDCVFPEAWEQAQDVAYLRFSLPDSDEGRAAAYHVELNLPQIPLNLRYEEV